MICTLCPRMCRAERTETEGGGICGVGTLPRIARAALHHDEEPVISQNGGSGAVFFSGCQLKCVFCQNYGISTGRHGKTVSWERLREIYKELIAAGAKNINLVSGTQFVPEIIRSLSPAPGVPVIWNSGGYERVETLRALEGKVNVYLPDFKYAFAPVSEKYSGAKDYPEVAVKALDEMYRQAGEVVLDENGNIQKGMIIRHLILPGETENAKRVLEIIKNRYPRAWVSLMAQYVPMGNARNFPEINRPITQDEYDEVVDYMLDLGLEDGFIQETESADSKYTPKFDLTGV